MIRSFRSRALRRFREKSDASGLNPQHIRKVEIILNLLDGATTAEAMNVPGLFFHKLIAENPSRWSVRVSANWRVTFSFEGEDAVAVDYEDYH